MELKKWPKIYNFCQMTKKVRPEDENFIFPVLNYRAKVKLHGTNAGIQIHPDGTVIAQSRKNILGKNKSGFKDNHGFGLWVESTKLLWENFRTPNILITIFGEWIGPTVQNGVAASKIKSKSFCIFSIRYENLETEEIVYLAEPEYIIEELINASIFIDGTIRVIPWIKIGEYDEWVIDLATIKKDDSFFKAIKETTDLVAEEDPFIFKEFGISGSGEGIVLYPMRIDGSVTSSFMFKSKSEKFTEVDKSKFKAAKQNPKKSEKSRILASALATNHRIEKGWNEITSGKNSFNGQQNPLQFMPQLMRWLSADIQSECSELIYEACLEWKDIARYIGTLAREWIILKSEERI